MLDKNKKLIEIFDVGTKDGTIGEAIEIMESLINENNTFGTKFTGGYIQHQQSKDILVLMYGYNSKNNPNSFKAELEEQEVDYIELALKAYIKSNRNKPKKIKLGIIEKRMNSEGGNKVW